MAWDFKRILKGFNRPFKSPAAKAKLALLKKKSNTKEKPTTIYFWTFDSLPVLRQSVSGYLYRDRAVLHRSKEPQLAAPGHQSGPAAVQLIAETKRPYKALT